MSLQVGHYKVKNCLSLTEQGTQYDLPQEIKLSHEGWLSCELKIFKSLNVFGIIMR